MYSETEAGEQAPGGTSLHESNTSLRAQGWPCLSSHLPKHVPVKCVSPGCEYFIGSRVIKLLVPLCIWLLYYGKGVLFTMALQFSFGKVCSAHIKLPKSSRMHIPRQFTTLSRFASRPHNSISVTAQSPLCGLRDLTPQRDGFGLVDGGFCFSSRVDAERRCRQSERRDQDMLDSYWTHASVSDSMA